MKGCKNCGCTEFIVDGWINCQGIVNLEIGGPDSVTVDRPDDLDFEMSDDSCYTCRECGAEYDYDDICEMAEEEEDDGEVTDDF